jgi:signal transduction histidine kinase
MNQLRRTCLALVVGLSFSGFVMAQADHGTKAEAKAMAEAAIAHVKKVGEEKAFEDFTSNKADWTKKDLYVSIIGLDGVVRAHGANPKLVGKNISGLKDQKGNAFVKEMVDTAGGKGEGWVEYDWPSPVTQKVEAKASYVQRAAGANYFAMVGVYR